MWQFIVLVEVILLWLVDYVEEGGVAFLVVPGGLEIGELALLFGLGMIVFWMFPLGNVTVFEAQLQQLVAPCHFVSIIVEFLLLLEAFQRIINLLFIVPHLLLSHPPYPSTHDICVIAVGSRVLDLVAELDPPRPTLGQVLSGLFGVALSVDLLLHSRGQLGDDVILVFDDLLLLDEEEAALQDVQEEPQVHQRLTDRVIGQLGATLQHLVDAVGIGKGIGEEEAAGEQDDALLVLLHDLGAEGDDVGHEGVVVLLGETVQSQAGVDDQL